MPQQNYNKTFIPLESDPEIFTTLGHQLGLADSVVFKELFSLDEPVDGKVLAYTLAFPTTPTYDAERAEDVIHKSLSPDGSDVVFLKQTIHNACGLYALLHAACNGGARNFIKHDSILHGLLETHASERTHFLDECQELEQVYTVAANEGYTAPPTDIEAEVDWHYACFAPSSTHHKLYELDGDRQGPLEHATLASDLTDFSSVAISLIRKYFEVAKGEKAAQFNVMALVEESV
ncbi:cysteine proteinase [Aureobasidium subglaciale]|nr:cysteine proteinase [Aureobasidium subglaciale]